MSKPVLGRGLGDLMNKAASPKTISEAESQKSDPTTGPGVSSLFKGNRPQTFQELEEPVVQSPVAPPAAKKRLPFPLWYLFVGDALLLLFAFLMVFKDTASLDWMRISIAIVAAVLGGVLAAVGVLLAQEKE